MFALAHASMFYAHDLKMPISANRSNRRFASRAVVFESAVSHSAGAHLPKQPYASLNSMVVGKSVIALGTNLHSCVNTTADSGSRPMVVLASSNVRIADDPEEAPEASPNRGG
jgi:hypothetical protein